MELRSKIKNECCVEELEEMIVTMIKVGFWSNEKILMECDQYIKDFYCNELDNITKDELLEVIKTLRKEFQNTGNQENFLKLESAFRSLKSRGLSHYIMPGIHSLTDLLIAMKWQLGLMKKGKRRLGFVSAAHPPFSGACIMIFLIIFNNRTVSGTLPKMPLPSLFPAIPLPVSPAIRR